MDEQMSSISNTKLLVLKTMWFVLNYFPIYYSKYIRYMLGAWMYRCIVSATLGLEDHVVCVELFSDILLEVHNIYVRIMDVQMYSISNTKLLILKTMSFVFWLFTDILLQVHKIYVRIMDVQMYSISNNFFPTSAIPLEVKRNNMKVLLLLQILIPKWIWRLLWMML